jgi:hypothetical protein
MAPPLPCFRAIEPLIEFPEANWNLYEGHPRCDGVAFVGKPRIIVLFLRTLPALAVLALLAGLVLGALASPIWAEAPAPSSGGLDVSTLQYEPADANGTTFWMWVNVTDSGSTVPYGIIYPFQSFFPMHGGSSHDQTDQ